MSARGTHCPRGAQIPGPNSPSHHQRFKTFFFFPTSYRRPRINWAPLSRSAIETFVVRVASNRALHLGETRRFGEQRFVGALAANRGAESGVSIAHRQSITCSATQRMRRTIGGIDGRYSRQMHAGTEAHVCLAFGLGGIQTCRLEVAYGKLRSQANELRSHRPEPM